MAAPKGNQFWKLRAKHGRDKLFATPELMLEAAFEYFQWCDKNPWMKAEAIKSGEMAGEMVYIPTLRPYTLKGFLVYINASDEYWRDFKKAGHKDFSGVISEIEQIIYTQKFEGAAVGAFNANIISRDLGLRDVTASELSGPNGADLLPPVVQIQVVKAGEKE